MLARAQLEAGDAGSNRRACWLARSAMEEVLDHLLEVRGLDTGPLASTRAKLSCLEVAYDDEPGLAARAQYAWTRLSEACHHHAYELSPTALEARDLVDAVSRLTDRS
jgi:hypothetical protein